MPVPIRAAVFDLDGLMFDTEALFFRVSSDMLAARGKRFSPEIMRAMIGRRSVDAGHVLKTMTGLDEPVDVLLAEVRQRFYAEIDTAVHPAPGLFTLLDRLRQNGLPLAVATSSQCSCRAAADAAWPDRPVPVRARFRGRFPRQARSRNLRAGHRAARSVRGFRTGAGRQPRGGRSRPEGGRPGGWSSPRA